MSAPSATPSSSTPAAAASSAPVSRLNAPLSAEELAREAGWKADPENAFDEGVELAFSRWEALNIAINNMAGPDVNDKVDEFITTAVDWFMDEKEKIHWDDVEGWLQEVLAEEFHIDAQDGSAEQMGRLLCTLYNDIFTKKDFAGLHRMIRTQSEVSKKLIEARRIGNAESEKHNRLMELEAEAEDDFSEGDEDEEGEDGVADGVANVSIGSSSVAARPEPVVEEKTAEQLQDEADGWETVPKKGRKGGKK